VVVCLLTWLYSGEKINFANEIVMHVNPLGAMAAGFVRGVGNYLSHKLV
jgi:hypothetical protein